MNAFRTAVWVSAFAVSALIGGAQTTPTETPAQSPGLKLDPSLENPKASESSGPKLTMEDVERIALAENPEVHVAARRLAMAEAHVPATGKLDDAQLMYRGWQVPLSRPWNYNDAQNMFMVAQALPGAGKRALQTTIAQSDVNEARADLDGVRLRVRIEARKAFYDLLLAEDELRIHDQHVGIAHQAVEAARIKYSVGKVPQQDILKAQLALTRLADHMIHYVRDGEVARARLNTVLGRDPSSPISVEGAFDTVAALPAEKALEQAAVESRPDLRAAQAAIEKSRQEQALAKRAFAPDFNVAAGYMLMPSGSDPRNNYMIEGSMTLPWLNRRKHEAEIAEAATKVTEQDTEAAALRTAAFGQIAEALADARAAQQLAKVYHDSLRPQAEATLHAAVIAYENNQTELLDLLDSQMAVIDVDLGWRQAMSDLAARMADLEMAVGAPIASNDTLHVDAKEEKQ